MKKLKKECQIILKLSFDKVPMEKIAQYFNYKNAQQAKNKKWACKIKAARAVKYQPFISRTVFKQRKIK